MNQEKDIDKLYLSGKMYLPNEDILLCDIQNISIDTRQKVYVTKKGTFYMLQLSPYKHEAKVISRDEALTILEQNPVYIITKNYDLVFGKPERG